VVEGAAVDEVVVLEKVVDDMVEEVTENEMLLETVLKVMVFKVDKEMAEAEEVVK
jgi:hypothetical protein